MGYQASLYKLPSDVLSGYLEDVLTATVIGAVAYGPPTMAQDWLRSCAGMDGASDDPDFEFWPGHRLEGGDSREPDVFVTDGATGSRLIVEAKRGLDPGASQLIDEGDAARMGYPDGQLHLLTVSDKATTPAAFRQIELLRPGLFTTMRHASWADLYVFLEGWASRSGVDAGHQRMINDALEVVRKFGRDPFRGLELREVRAMDRDARWMYALPRELAKVHRDLSRSLEGLRRPLYPIGTTVTTDIVGSVSYNFPEQWFPRHFTLRYGGSVANSDRYFFVRAVLNPPAIWVGYAPRRADIEAVLANPVGLETLVRRARKRLRVVTVTPKQRPFEVLSGPLEMSEPVLRELAGDARAGEINLIRVFPMTLMARPNAEIKLEAALRGLIRLCRSVRTLGAP